MLLGIELLLRQNPRVEQLFEFLDGFDLILKRSRSSGVILRRALAWRSARRQTLARSAFNRSIAWIEHSRQTHPKHHAARVAKPVVAHALGNHLLSGNICRLLGNPLVGANIKLLFRIALDKLTRIIGKLNIFDRDLYEPYAKAVFPRPRVIVLVQDRAANLVNMGRQLRDPDLRRQRVRGDNE